MGLFVSHTGHHRHAAYIIRNSEHLLGFAPAEVELIALLARYHRSVIHLLWTMKSFELSIVCCHLGNCTANMTL